MICDTKKATTHIGGGYKKNLHQQHVLVALTPINMPCKKNLYQGHVITILSGDVFQQKKVLLLILTKLDITRDQGKNQCLLKMFDNENIKKNIFMIWKGSRRYFGQN